MKKLILLLAIVAVGCSRKQNPRVHHYLVQDSPGSLYSMSDTRELKLGDSVSAFQGLTDHKVMIVGEIYGNRGIDSIYSWVQGVRLRGEPRRIDNGFFPIDTNKYITRSKNYAYLVRNWHGQGILAVAADTSYIEFYGKRFYPETTNNYNFSDIDWGPAEITFGDTSKTKP